MKREEFYKLTDILNSEVLGNFMHGGEADELIAMFEDSVEHSNILEQEEPVSEELEEAAEDYCKSTLVGSHSIKKNAFRAGAQWQKEQMMAKAINAKLLEGHLIRQKDVTHPLHVGDKVKIIVIKED